MQYMYNEFNFDFNLLINNWSTIGHMVDQKQPVIFPLMIIIESLFNNNPLSKYARNEIVSKITVSCGISLKDNLLKSSTGKLGNKFSIKNQYLVH
jgi:hypothetical protein